MKIAMVSPQWLSTKGGPTNYVKNLKLNLEAWGHSVSILTSERHPDVYSFSAASVVRELQMLYYLQRIRPDVIHIHGRLHYIIPSVLYRSLTNRQAKVVFTFHTQPRVRDYLGLGGPVKVPYSGLKGKIGEMLLKKCTIVTSVSDNLIKTINHYCGMPIRKYEVIPSGAAITQVEDSSISRFVTENLLKEASPVLVSVGVLSWDWKVLGHRIAIEAVSILKANYPNIKLLIVGDGTYMRYLERTVESLGVRDNVLFCGNVEDPAVILRLADIYVHMAVNEGSPLAVIEAMMAKKTIVAANKGGIPELIEDGTTGFIIEPDAAILAERLIELLQNKKLRDMLARNAFDYAYENLRWHAVATEYLSLYEKGECE